MTYCNINELIPIDNGFFYLNKDKTVYFKEKGINFKPILKIDYQPKIKTTNKEFNHKIAFLKVKTLSYLNKKLKELI